MEVSQISPDSTDVQIGDQLKQLGVQREDVEVIDRYGSGISRMWWMVLKPLCREIVRLRTRAESLESRVKALEGLLEQK